MKLKESYSHKIKYYFDFRGDRDDSLEIAEQYYLYLKTNISKSGTRIPLWYACVNYYKSNVISKTITLRNWIERIAWVKYKYGILKEDDTDTIYHVNDLEYEKLLENA